MRRLDGLVSVLVQRAASEAVVAPLRKGVEVHVYLHCVANKEPNPGQYRMLFATGKSTRRLYREGDETHPKRHGKVTPERGGIPPEYHYLLDWYTDEYAARENRWLNGLFELAGAGKEIFAGNDTPLLLDVVQNSAKESCTGEQPIKVCQICQYD